MFRKGKEKIELRHQRNPDFVFEFIRDIKNDGLQDKPEFTYKMIETLLPESSFDSVKYGKAVQGFNLIELWAKAGSCRSHWAKISHNPDVTLTFEDVTQWEN